MIKVGIVTDSAAGFSLEEVEKYPDLTVVPLIIIEKDKQKDYDDNNIDITNEQIYQKMVIQRKKLVTSQSNPEKLTNYWNKALEKFDQILFLPIAAAASKQYETAKNLANNPQFKNKVVVYETGAASIPLKAMVLLALELAKKGKAIKEIIKNIAIFRTSYKFFLGLNDLSTLATSGRIPLFLRGLANLFRIKIVLSCKNKIKKVASARTMDGLVTKMLESISTKTKDVFNQTLYIIDGWCKKEYLNAAIKSAKNYGFKNIKVVPLCNVMQSHTGNNTIGFSIIPNKWNIEI